jgi:hypothetical protein
MLAVGYAGVAYAQLRAYQIHSRGMLHQTVFNSGELGRGYDRGATGAVAGVPSFEWPSHSAATIDGVAYKGQYNSFGGGVYLSATRRDSSTRGYAYCGAFEDPVVGTYSFPLTLARVENYPVLENGELNPNYNPDEAEEIITAQWATNLGLTVTRTSRSWSYPDYDDFIIYEYEVENTGDTRGDPGTPTMNATLGDVLVGFTYALTPSMFGYERTFNRWDGADFSGTPSSGDMFPRFDRTRWMNYGLDRNGKPDPHHFADWSATGKYGGGLLSPQAPGFAILYYDTVYLARKGDTQVQVRPSDTLLVWDANLHLKQPFLNRMETGVFSMAKIESYLNILNARKNNPYTSTSAFGPDWVGRGSYNWRQSQKFGIGHIMVLGPYTMPPGSKIRFAVAEVVGYGAARPGERGMVGKLGIGVDQVLQDEGGSCGENCNEPTSPALNAWNPVPNWWADTSFGGISGNQWTHGADYLSTYALPMYVNSGVVTVREVADRAIQAYSGLPLTNWDSTQYWPDRSPERGVYQIPVVVPAPAIKVTNTPLAENQIIWLNNVEGFSTPRLIAPIHHYEAYKASHPLGPWTKLDSVGIADPRYYANGRYRITDLSTRVGEAYYYVVLSVDAAGNRSGPTNLTLHQTQLGATETLEQVYVVPNPFLVRSGLGGTTGSGTGDAGAKIGFYNLPKHCTIRIISYSGQLVQTISHDSELYSTEYFQVTRNNQLMASGLYFFVVETPDGKRTHGKFVIIH